MAKPAVGVAGMEEQDDESPIKSVRKAIDILDALSDARRALRVGEIASKLNMSVSAVSRLIATLAKGELVYQDEETGRCYLGLGLTVLGANALGRRAIDRIAMPIMDELANRIRGYVSLSRLARGRVVFIRALPSPPPPPPGQRPLCCRLSVGSRQGRLHACATVAPQSTRGQSRCGCACACVRARQNSVRRSHGRRNARTPQ